MGCCFKVLIIQSFEMKQLVILIKTIHLSLVFNIPTELQKFSNFMRKASNNNQSSSGSGETTPSTRILFGSLQKIK